MEYKNLTQKVKIPVLGLGTWKMGGEMWADRTNDDKYILAIKYAIQKGITHIDTAEIYGAGHSEELVGEAIKGFDRKKLFITSKVWPGNLSYDKVLKSCEASLERLQIGYLSLYLIHWPNPLASIKNTMAAFNRLVDQGLIKHVGVSNFSVKQLQNAQKYSKNKIVCNQVHYSLTHRDPVDGLLEFCRAENIILTAYSPLDQGKLAQGEYESLEDIAKKYKKTPIQIALHWLIEKPNVITILKSSSKEHIDELLGSLGWKMSPEDQDFLSESF